MLIASSRRGAPLSHDNYSLYPALSCLRNSGVNKASDHYAAGTYEERWVCSLV